jgi:hypothetical protein
VTVKNGYKRMEKRNFTCLSQNWSFCNVMWQVGIAVAGSLIQQSSDADPQVIMSRLCANFNFFLNYLLDYLFVHHSPHNQTFFSFF